MILGISLVVNELNKGQRMVFRYPESIPASVEKSNSKGLIKLYNQYFSLSLENLAKLFRPKNALYNKVLDIAVDDLCFVSYPCQCQGLAYDESTDIGGTSNSSGYSPTNIPSQTPSGAINTGTGEVITMFNVIITSVSAKAMRKIDPDFEFKCQHTFASSPGSDPVAAALGLQPQTYGVCKQTLRRLVENIADALLQQERSSRYVSEQVTLMLRILDNWNLTKADSSNSTAATPVMESGLTSALALCALTGQCDPNAMAALTAGQAVRSGAPAAPTDAASATNAGNSNSRSSTPRSSRSNSSAPPPVVEGLSTVAGSVSARHSRNNSSVPPEATAPASNKILTSVSEDPAKLAAAIGRGTTPPVSSAGVPLSPQFSGSTGVVSKALSVETDFVNSENVSGRTSPALSGQHAASLMAAASAGSAGGAAEGAKQTAPQHPPHPPVNVALAMMHGSGRELMHLVDGGSGGVTRTASPSLATGNADHPHPLATYSSSATASRANSGLVPLPSRASSGLSTTPSKAAAGAAASLSVSLPPAGIADAHGSPVNKDRHATEWGPHLLSDFMAQSSLANELRMLYHNIQGGHSVNIAFNEEKSGTQPLFCKDRSLCEETQYLRSLRYSAGVGSGGALVAAPNRNSITVTNIRAVSGAGGRLRQLISPAGRATGGLTSALQSGRKSKDSAKMKGINLNTQTMLKIADSDTIMNVLHSLDSSTFSMIVASMDASEANSAAGSAVDLEAMKQQLRMLSSSRLYAFVEASDPTQSFLDLSMTLDEPVEELVSMANYLRSWGLAEVIPVIYNRSCFKIHAKAVLHRDSRVGRAYEALLLSFGSGFWDQLSPDRSSMSRPNSEPFLFSDSRSSRDGGEFSAENRRRATSVASTGDATIEPRRTFQEMHRQNHSGSNLAAVGALQPTSGAPAAGHYMVSPAISKYRQRREGVREELPSQQGLRNSRSSEQFLRNLASNNKLDSAANTAGARSSAVIGAAGAGAAAGIPAPPSMARSATAGAAASGAHSPVPTVPQEAPATAPPASRDRGNSVGQGTERPAQQGFKAVLSALFGQAASQANNHMQTQRELTAPPAEQNLVSGSAADVPCKSFRDVSDHAADPSAPSMPAAAAAVSREDSRRSGGGEVMMSSSYPPSSLGNSNLSAANREMGFQHVVALAEVGTINAPLMRSPLAVEDAVYSVVGNNRSLFPYEETPLVEEVVPVVHNLDTSDNIPPQYSLPAALAAFNGAPVLQEVVERLPGPLKDFSVEIVVFLLRWHIIVPVDTYIVNMLNILDQHAAADPAVATPTTTGNTTSTTVPMSGSAGGGSGGSAQVRAEQKDSAGSSSGSSAPLSSSAGRVNFALSASSHHSAGNGGEPSAYSVSPGSSSFTQSYFRGYSESKSNLAQMDDLFAPMRAQLPKELSPQEAMLMEKIFPFLLNAPMSTKTVGEIAWVLRVPEEDVLHVVEQVPYLQVVKRLSC